MSFGRNPHVAKAQAFEQKAADAPDAITRERALRDAAHQWDRAAEREKPGKLRVAYEDNATRNRALADEPGAAFTDDVTTAPRFVFDSAPPPRAIDPLSLN